MITVSELIEQAMTAGSQSEVDDIFEALVQAKLTCACKKCMSDPTTTKAKAETIVRDYLGYIAGYYCNDTRERVERLFKCEHPNLWCHRKKGRSHRRGVLCDRPQDWCSVESWGQR